MKFSRKSRVIGIALSCAAALPACGGSDATSQTGDHSPEQEDVAIIPGKSDDFAFSYGIYRYDEYDEPTTAIPFTLALHAYQDGVPDGFAGHFDYGVADFNTGESAAYAGVFKLYKYAGKQRIRLDDYQGKTLARFDWSFVDGKLSLNEHGYDLLNSYPRDHVLGDCEAVSVSDFIYDEGFTPWEYPSVEIETDGQGGYELGIGSHQLKSTYYRVTAKTKDDGELEGSAEALDGHDRIVVRISGQAPYRGEVLHASPATEPLQGIAKLVCFPPTSQKLP